MKTDTNKKIFEFIKEKGQVTPKEIVNFIGFSAPAVFRQLKKLQESGLVQKSGCPPSVFYHLPMTEKERLVQETIKWVCDKEANIINNQDFYCSARDIFQFRNERILKTLFDNGVNESLSYLLIAAIGEIGNNSFDHNLGKWRDVPGVYFKVDMGQRLVMLGDRGQGVFATLNKIRPDIENDKEALHIAFTEIVSGRSPERRGNGLKFVKKVLVENNLKLLFYSGRGLCEIKNQQVFFTIIEKNILGTVVIIEF